MNQNNMAENVSPLPSQVEDVIQQCKKVLEQHYQQRLTDVFLYGSSARQELTPNSDLDLLVVLPAPFDYGQELRTIVDLLYPLQLEASHWISAKPAEAQKFRAGANQLYRNIHKEGRRL
ncbi:dna polymerase beta domain protein region [Leptolyngbya sp. Heron Island J]|uniref:nucleotidyltransferase domain-containing protein n=1 Tax=Leptolyngbya sp. Heron Island J TaxID=1385935 RepID=UPI0003B9EEA3|nr:nucleotidyltransferase domain-containing protein [Leptolyngbya sp. Heron Island J]ESA37385.1 dna polymerase beta domain protein region [Leptolyngbya sp. Heron Island J]